MWERWWTNYGQGAECELVQFFNPRRQIRRVSSEIAAVLVCFQRFNFNENISFQCGTDVMVKLHHWPNPLLFAAYCAAKIVSFLRVSEVSNRRDGRVFVREMMDESQETLPPGGVGGSVQQPGGPAGHLSATRLTLLLHLTSQPMVQQRAHRLLSVSPQLFFQRFCKEISAVGGT